MIFVDEPNEPAHVHVFKDDNAAKFRLSPPDVHVNYGFRPHDISEILEIIEDHKTQLIAQYERIHGTK